MKNLKKILIIALAVIMFGGGTVGAYAWWDSLQVDVSETNVVTIGGGLDLVVATAVIDPATDGNLIPASAAATTGSTYSIDIDYDVNLDVAVDAPMTLSVNVTNITVDGVANPYGLIDVAITNPGSIQNSTVTVTLTVTIDDSSLDPADEAAAKTALEGNDISFDVTFQVS